jgi:hypothetical protein
MMTHSTQRGTDQADPQFNTDRTYPGRWTITFSNPPINMFLPTTIVDRLPQSELEPLSRRKVGASATRKVCGRVYWTRCKRLRNLAALVDESVDAVQITAVN